MLYYTTVTAIELEIVS